LADAVAVYILNFNGRPLLAECLPSIVRAAAASRHNCRVVVIDNHSSDDSRDWLAQAHPRVEVVRCPNKGLCSFNRVLAEGHEAVSVLLNNDIKLAADAIDPLVDPLLESAGRQSPALLLTAPLCWRFDETTYEGFRTAVRWRWGLVQATALYPGHEGRRSQAGLTASAGAALAVDRRRFLELGGFDELYLPGRLEDLDLAFRGYLAGFRALFVPESVAYHRGEATFAVACGAHGSLGLALRNTLLFQWKNLRHPWHIARHLAALPARIVFDIFNASRRKPAARFLFCRALVGAIGKLPELIRARRRTVSAPDIELQFFRRFAPQRMAHKASTPRPIGRALKRPFANVPAGSIS
jgi:GT2 family glycosyltransferase